MWHMGITKRTKTTATQAYLPSQRAATNHSTLSAQEAAVPLVKREWQSGTQALKSYYKNTATKVKRESFCIAEATTTTKN